MKFIIAVVRAEQIDHLYAIGVIRAKHLQTLGETLKWEGNKWPMQFVYNDRFCSRSNNQTGAALIGAVQSRTWEGRRHRTTTLHVNPSRFALAAGFRELRPKNLQE